MKSIVLASSSPRRRKLLEDARITFKVDPSSVDESQVSKSSPSKMVAQLSRKKAREVADRHPNSIVIGADTTVYCEGKIFEKPVDRTEARQMLKFLSGKAHVVYTGITVIDTEINQEVTEVDKSTVFFNELSQQQIEDYLQTDEAMDKAGAYAIQEGLSQHFIKRTEGEYSTIVGLPIRILQKILDGLK